MDRGRCFLAVITALAAVVLWPRTPAADDDEPWIVEPGPEKPDAIKAGATELEVGLSLAKKKQYADAVKALETVARTWPAALHDCNLSLAYLRAGALTRAQLMWDVAGLRNASRPNWCTGDLSTQLATALRAAGYVPVSIDVTPPDAVIEVGGARVRGIKVLWLATGPATISARARELSTTKSFDVAANVRVHLELREPVITPPDAGVPDAPVVVAPPPDAAVAIPMPPPPEPSHTLRYAAAGTAAVGLLGGSVFYVLARGARSDANAVFPSDPAFDDAKRSFETRRVVAISLLAIGTVAAAYVGYDLASKPSRKRVAIQPAGKGAAVTIGGTW